ncbi:MAG: tRNA (N(6)-L-threonylcarbamoyladenosine(37)-C(2))-methylthiotransferase MtaB [Elusimicrobia bacterium]|nr:tRNA (N(6)-L-threonylcarbamoyladenosine(37)-C(2))-methylthiotransferase MtaB [Candidatus Obscuribacterium magneticum]
MKLWSFTFGCKVNQYETEWLRQSLRAQGSELTDRPEEADLCLINSCSVTAFADKECRQMIRKVLRVNPQARLVVTGCYATRVPQEVRGINDRVEVYSNREKEGLPTCLGFELAEKPLGIQQFSGRARAFLKVQDGCRAPCNYCIIPVVRPFMWSKPVDRVIGEVEALVGNGYQEIVLTGIRLGLYRGERNRGGTVDLLGLLKLLAAIPLTFRIRLSSLEVTEVSDALVAFVKETPKICRHFHIPLQSGDDGVLKDMARWYDTTLYRERVDKIRAFLPDCGLTTDVMAGYPTETDDGFERSFQFVAEMGFSGLHVFRFSARGGTPSAALKPLSPRVVEQRAKAFAELDKKFRERFYQVFKGTRREVLPEPSGEGWTDNYIRVQLPPGRLAAGLSQERVFHQGVENKL